MRNIMVGLTHTEDGTPIIKAPKTLKVGIGIPKGRAIRVFIHPSGQWYVMKGEMKASGLKEAASIFDTRAEAEVFYHAEKNTAPEVTYPRRLPYFTFSKPGITDKGGEVYEPDFDAIEAAGPVPTSVDIVFSSEDPFNGAYQMWSATELRCKGDGIDAERSVAFEPNNPAAIQAKAEGKRTFPILGGCWTKGCEYAGKDCKVGAGLSFHLANLVTPGVTAFFHTTGFRSTRDIFSSLEEIRGLLKMAIGTGITWTPMTLKLRPYITKPENGKASTQYAARIEMNPVTLKKMQKTLAALTMSTQLQIAAPQFANPEEITEAETDDLPISAQAMAAEFYPEVEDDDTPAPALAAQASVAEVKTAEKQASAGERLRNRNKEEKAAAEAKAAEVDVAKAAEAKAAADKAQADQTAQAAEVEAATSAAAASTAPSPTAKLPWSDRQGMNSVMMAHKERLTAAVFDATVNSLSIMYGTLRFDDPKALALHEKLVAGGAAPVADGGLF